MADIHRSNPSGGAISGVATGVTGWNDSVRELVSGEANTESGSAAAAARNADLDNHRPYPTDPNTGNGALDPCLDGFVGGGDEQLRLDFRIVQVARRDPTTHSCSSLLALPR